ncbi:MAG TPA: LysM peptidoglycan-binding domain-containing protein [Anaerolineaceae bacterium]|nr:LysM peptidoglycan-binding domain-containing protein [Anaerolineaceae bacterium]
MHVRKSLILLLCLLSLFGVFLLKSTQTVSGAAVEMPMAQILTSTPWPDGSIYHIPVEGDTLWSISEAYGVSIRDINILNGNSPEANEIYIGQRLLIRRGEPMTATPEASPTPVPVTPSPTVFKPSRTPIPSATAIPSPTPTQAPSTVQLVFGDSKRVGWTITAISLVGIVLVVIFGFIYKPKV